MRFKKKQNCAPNTRHYAGGHLTCYGGFSLLHGMDSYLYRPWTESHRPSRVLSTLRDNGYKLKAFDASGLVSYYPTVIGTDEFDRYETYINLRGHEKDEKMVADFLSDWNSRAGQHPQFSFLFFYSTHDPYYFPPTEDFKSPSSDNDRLDNYYKSAHFVDRLVGKILANVGPDTIFIFTGDHGEAFGEFGKGHAEPRFEDVRTRVPLLFCLPKHDWTRVELSSHADIWPTLFDYMGASKDWRRSSFGGHSLLDPNEKREFIPLTGAFFPTEGRSLALAVPEGKVLLKNTGTSPLDLQIEGQLDGADLSAAPFAKENQYLSSFIESMKRAFY